MWKASPSRPDQRLLHRPEAGNYRLNTPEPTIAHAPAHRRTQGCDAPVVLMVRFPQSRPDLIYFRIDSFGSPEHNFATCGTLAAALEPSVSDTHQHPVKTSSAGNSPPSHQVEPAHFSMLRPGKDTQEPAQLTWRKPAPAHPPVRVMRSSLCAQAF